MGCGLPFLLLSDGIVLEILMGASQANVYPRQGCNANSGWRPDKLLHLCKQHPSFLSSQLIAFIGLSTSLAFSSPFQGPLSPPSTWRMGTSHRLVLFFLTPSSYGGPDISICRAAL